MKGPALDMLLGGFRGLNTAMWPLLVVEYLLLLGAVYLALKPRQGAGQAIMGFLSFLWLSTAFAFGLLYMVPVYPLFYACIALFVLQAILLVVVALRAPLPFRVTGSAPGVVGGLLVLFAAVGYPLVGTLLGRGYAELVLIGAPCPTAVVTFGLLLWSERRVPRYLLVVPLIWALMGLSSVSVGLWDDLGLTISGLVATAMILYRDAKRREPTPGATTAHASG